MQRFTRQTFAAGIAALMAAGLTIGGATRARAQDESDGTLVIKRADGSVLVRKPALTLEGSGELALKPVRYYLTVGPLIRGSYTGDEWAAKVKAVRAFLTAQGIADTDLQEGGISAGLALSTPYEMPDAAQHFIESLSKAPMPLQITVTGYPKETDEKTLLTAALAKALEDAEARRNLFAKAARPRELVLLSMEEGAFQLNPARIVLTLENGKFSPAPSVALAPVAGPNAAAYATMSATLRYGWKDEMGEGIGVPGVARAIAPAKPTAKPAPKKTAAKQK